MLKKLAIATIWGSFIVAPPVQAQAIVAAIGDTVGRSGVNPDCPALKWTSSQKAIDRFNAEAEPAFLAYLAVAKAKGDPTPTFKGHHPWMRWQLDGEKTLDLSSIQDPWAARIDRLEQIDITLGRMNVYGRGVWKAYDVQGALLGTYYVRLSRKTKGYGVNWVDLWSPGQEDKAPPISPFCAWPGDHEEYIAAKEKQERERAERRAARAQQGRN